MWDAIPKEADSLRKRSRREIVTENSPETTDESLMVSDE